MALDPVVLTRRLVDIESTSGKEHECGEFLFGFLSGLASQFGGTVERMPVQDHRAEGFSQGRANILATFGDPVVTLTTHFDTVPPFIASGEDSTNVYGRGSCDAKGILASMICAAESLLAQGRRGIALLFVVGEEEGSAGAYEAARHPIGSAYLINGEPTENRLALGSKGALRLVLRASGKMAHSAYPELGESAIEKLLDALHALRAATLPKDEVLGDTTLNIGLIEGGRAPNVVPDRASCEILIRLVGPPDDVRTIVRKAVGGFCEVDDGICIPALHLGSVPGFETTVVKYTTDVPIFGPGWGEPFLIGPGTIHVAHTPHEAILKDDLVQAVQAYRRLVEHLLDSA